MSRPLPAPGAPRLSERIALGLYSTAQVALLPLLLPLLAFHPRLHGALLERFGRGHRGEPGAIWLHGSSAGDLAALVALTDPLQEQGFPLVFTAWTRSGHDLGALRLRTRAPIFRAPLDLALAVRSVLGRLRPRLLVLECLEMWPRLVRTCQARGVPVAVVNGRLSRRSLERYRRLPWVFERCFSELSLVVALSTADARRFAEAGTPASRILVAPSSRHAPSGGAVAGPSPCPSLVLGSVHRGEESLLLPRLSELHRSVPGLQVTVAPRHPHRARRIARRLERLGVPCSLMSAPNAGDAAVRIVDVMGALAGSYAGAHLAFVGGTLVPRGGHNLLEPAALGVPVLFGPHVDNWREEAGGLLESGGGRLVRDGEEFLSVARELLLDRQRQRVATVAAGQVARRFAGAAGQIATHLARLLAGGAPC